METWFQRQFLVAALLGGTLCMAMPAFADEEEPFADLPVFDSGLLPDFERDEVKLSAIDTENFEIGISAGLISIEDFETNGLTTAALRYHITEDFFAEARYSVTEAGETSFEKLSGAVQLLADEEREVAFYDMSLGVNVFPGEAFILDRWAVDTSFYLIGGIGATQFAGNEELTVNAGVGYRVVANDFITLNVHVRDHMFETEITGERKLTHNFELSAGIAVFF